MIRNERWNTHAELKRFFPVNTDPACGAGPVLFEEFGRLYVDDSESHVAAIGNTGKGKTTCVSLNFIREVLRSGESAIILDPKKEAYTKLCRFVPEAYQTFCVDLREPSASPHGWNPLKVPLQLYRSGNPVDRDRAAEMIADLWAGVYPIDANADRFWSEAAANYAKGLTYALFDLMGDDESVVHLDTIAMMMEQSETRVGMYTVSRALYEKLPEGSIARRNLASYVTAPNDTRASIHSVAVNGIELFSRSRGLMAMLADDNLDVMGMDFTRPFVLFICVADESRNYHGLAGLLVAQMSQQLIRRAQDMGGRLPVRVNIVLEELGSVGRSIPNLPNLMAVGRSRNIRMLLLLQDDEQLTEIFGSAAARAIRACLGVQFCFSTNSWDTLTEWSRRCGERCDPEDGRVEPLITAAQLSAMPTGTALILIGGRYKLISALPPFYKLYGDAEPGDVLKPCERGEIHTLDLQAWLREESQRRTEGPKAEDVPAWLRPQNPPAPVLPQKPTPVIPAPENKPEPPEKKEAAAGFDVDQLIARIDAQIAQLEAAEAAEAAKQWQVVVTDNGRNERLVFRAIMHATPLNGRDVRKLMSKCPYTMVFPNHGMAARALAELERSGATATLQEAEPEQD